MSRRDAGTHDTGANDADLVDVSRLDAGIGNAGVFLQALSHEEQGNQVARDRAADQRRERLGLGLQSFLQREIAAFFDGIEGGERGRILAAGLGQYLGAGDGEGERFLLLAQADSQLLARTHFFPVTGQIRPFEQALRLLDELLDRHHVEDHAALACFHAVNCLAGTDHLGGEGRADEARQPLRAAPAGD